MFVVLRALRLFKVGDDVGAALAAGAAVEAHPSAGSFWRTVAAVVTGVAAHWRGRYDEARPALRDAARIAAEDGNALARQYVLGYLALDAVEHDGPQAGLALLPEPADESLRGGLRFIARIQVIVGSSVQRGGHRL